MTLAIPQTRRFLPVDQAPIRLAIVVHVMQVAGAEMLVAETVRRLQGWVVPTILCLDRIGPLGESLIREGIEVLSLNRRPGRDWRLAWRLARILRERNTEVIHAHQYTPFFYAALARVLLKGSPPLIFTEHGRHYPDCVSRLRRAVNSILLNRLASAINACCGFSAESLSLVDGFAKHRIEVIANGIDLTRYCRPSDRKSVRHRLGLDPARRYIANVARFHPVKDHALLLRAFAKVATVRDNVDLLLVGDGTLRSELEALVRQLSIERQVCFLGVRSDVPAILQAADVFALTSLSEAASLTLLEAMASSLPVVVTEVGGNPEIVRHGIEGILVPRGNAEATAAAILRLLDDPTEAAAMGAAGRARVAARYRLEHTIDNYLRRYQQLARRSFPSAVAGPTG